MKRILFYTRILFFLPQNKLDASKINNKTLSIIVAQIFFPCLFTFVGSNVVGFFSFSFLIEVQLIYNVTFQICSKVIPYMYVCVYICIYSYMHTHTCIYMYIYFFRLFSIITQYKILYSRSLLFILCMCAHSITQCV